MDGLAAGESPGRATREDSTEKDTVPATRYFPNATFDPLETCPQDEGMEDEDAIQKAEKEESTEPVQGTGETPSSPPPASGMTVDSDPLETGGEEAKDVSLLTKLNPFRMFRKKSPDFFIKEGKDFLENQAYAQALLAFNNALAIDPNSSAAFRGLGKVFFKKGGRTNMKTSLNHYQEAIKRNPMDHELYAISAKIYDAMGQRKEATLERKKFVIVRALDVDAKNPIANNNMGILFLQQGKTDTALSYFQKAIDSDKNYDVALRNQAAVYLKMAKETEDGQKKLNYNLKAREGIERAVEISPTPASLLAFGRILLKEGNFDQVLTIVEKIDEMDPANKHVFKLKQLTLEGLGRFEEARDAENSYRIFSGGQVEEEAPPEE